MSNPSDTLTIPVDLTNPGQFFACCALLELASRLDKYAEGGFKGSFFSVAGKIKGLVEKFLACEVVPIAAESSANDDYESGADESSVAKTTPLMVGGDFNIRLDWWTDPTATTKAKLKTWSAGQKVTDLFNGTTKSRATQKGSKITYVPSMRDHFRDVVKAHPNDWLRQTIVTDTPMPYCYDSRLSRKAAIDAGHYRFGLLAFSPAVDVLVHVAFQRFRPRMIEQWNRNLYCTWSVPLTVELASVVTLGIIPDLVDLSFEFPIKPCDAAGRYKLFGHAQPVRRSNV